jgi:hypothetical protein
MPIVFDQFERNVYAIFLLRTHSYIWKYERGKPKIYTVCGNGIQQFNKPDSHQATCQDKLNVDREPDVIL